MPPPAQPLAVQPATLMKLEGIAFAPPASPWRLMNGSDGLSRTFQLESANQTATLTVTSLISSWREKDDKRCSGKLKDREHKHITRLARLGNGESARGLDGCDWGDTTDKSGTRWTRSATVFDRELEAGYWFYVEGDVALQADGNAALQKLLDSIEVLYR